jgi:polyhydroxyalkanoate synthesis regulator phasin
MAALTIVVAACESSPTTSETLEPQVSEEVLGLSRVQDGNTLRTRLSTAIDSGWISREQARRMARELSVAGRRIREAVAAGELTGEEGRRRFLRAELGAFGRRIRENVNAGTMTAEEARAAYSAYRQLMGIDAITRTGR